MKRGVLFAAALALSGCTLKSEPIAQADAAAPQADADPSADAGIDAAVSLTRCDSLDAIVCDGFEAGIDSWTQQISGGTLELVSDPVFRGASALRATTQAAGAEAFLQQDFAPITAGSIYTRAYFYLPSTLITAGLVEITNTGDSSGTHFHYSIDLDTSVFVINNQSANVAAPIPRDTWFCAEWRIDIGAAGGGELFINEQSAATLTGLDTDLAGGYTRLELGIYNTAPANGAYELAIDEVAMDVVPIGCD